MSNQAGWNGACKPSCPRGARIFCQTSAKSAGHIWTATFSIFSMQPDDPPYAPAAFHKFTKTAKPQAHVSQAIHRNPCLAASHAPRIPHTITKLQKSDANFDETSVRPRKSPTNPASTNILNLRCLSPQTPGQSGPDISRTYVTSPQIHAPTNSRKILHTCEGGGVAGTSCMRIPARTRARPWACTRISVPWSYLHGFAHTCTGMRIPIRVCAHLHGHAHGHGHMPSGTPSTRPAAGPLKCAPGQLTQIPCADEGGMGMASLGDAAATPASTRRLDVRGGQHLHVMIGLSA